MKINEEAVGRIARMEIQYDFDRSFPVHSKPVHLTAGADTPHITSNVFFFKSVAVFIFFSCECLVAVGPLFPPGIMDHLWLNIIM